MQPLVPGGDPQKVTFKPVTNMFQSKRISAHSNLSQKSLGAVLSQTQKLVLPKTIKPLEGPKKMAEPLKKVIIQSHTAKNITSVRKSDIDKAIHASINKGRFHNDGFKLRDS